MIIEDYEGIESTDYSKFDIYYWMKLIILLGHEENLEENKK